MNRYQCMPLRVLESIINSSLESISRPSIGRNYITEDIVNSTFNALGKSPGLRTTENVASSSSGSLKRLAGAAALLPLFVLSADVTLAQGPRLDGERNRN